ncbi:MAG: hypothetical protein WD824_25960 [Cyclobacteriaceae bacterium]
MQKFLPGLFSVAVIFLMCLDSCVNHDFPEYVCTDTYTFAEDVQPIIETKCAIAGCHNGDMGESLNWTNFENFHERAESGLVKFRVTHRIMPPSNSPAGPLSQEQINAIACWTDQGALNN